MTEREIAEKLLPIIKERDKDFKFMILVYLYTGCRGAEVCNMHRDHIWTDEETGRQFITIPHTKTHRIRHIPVSAPLSEILAGLPQKGYLFPRWRNVQTVSKKLKRYLRKAGLGYMWLHGLRHTTISHLTMKGAPKEAIMKISGHTSEKTLKRYQHLSPGYLAEAADKLRFEEGKKKLSVKEGGE